MVIKVRLCVYWFTCCVLLHYWLICALLNSTLLLANHYVLLSIIGYPTSNYTKHSTLASYLVNFSSAISSLNGITVGLNLCYPLCLLAHEILIDYVVCIITSLFVSSYAIGCWLYTCILFYSATTCNDVYNYIYTLV